jgi:hypothetical protein
LIGPFGLLRVSGSFVNGLIGGMVLGFAGSTVGSFGSFGCAIGCSFPSLIRFCELLS